MWCSRATHSARAPYSMLLKPLMLNSLLPVILFYLFFIWLLIPTQILLSGKPKPSGTSTSRQVSPCSEFASSHPSPAPSLISKCFSQPVELCGNFWDTPQGLVEPMEPGVWCWGILLRKTLVESQMRILGSCRECALSSLQIPALPDIPIMSLCGSPHQPASDFQPSTSLLGLEPNLELNHKYLMVRRK